MVIGELTLLQAAEERLVMRGVDKDLLIVGLNLAEEWLVMVGEQKGLLIAGPPLLLGGRAPDPDFRKQPAFCSNRRNAFCADEANCREIKVQIHK